MDAELDPLPLPITSRNRIPRSRATSIARSIRSGSAPSFCSGSAAKSNPSSRTSATTSSASRRLALTFTMDQEPPLTQEEQLASQDRSSKWPHENDDDEDRQTRRGVSLDWQAHWDGLTAASSTSSNNDLDRDGAHTHTFPSSSLDLLHLEPAFANTPQPSPSSSSSHPLPNHGAFWMDNSGITQPDPPRPPTPISWDVLAATHQQAAVSSSSRPLEAFSSPPTYQGSNSSSPGGRYMETMAFNESPGISVSSQSLAKLLHPTNSDSLPSSTFGSDQQRNDGMNRWGEAVGGAVEASGSSGGGSRTIHRKMASGSSSTGKGNGKGRAHKYEDCQSSSATLSHSTPSSASPKDPQSDPRPLHPPEDPASQPLPHPPSACDPNANANRSPHRGSIQDQPERTPEPLSEYTCPICFFPPTNATLTPCGHICCGSCLFAAVKTTLARNGYGPGMAPIYPTRRGGDDDPSIARCPVCRAPLAGWDGKGGGVVGLKVRGIFTV